MRIYETNRSWKRVQNIKAFCDWFLVQTLTPLKAQIMTSDQICYITIPSLDTDATFTGSVIQSTARGAKTRKAINPVPRICLFNLGEALGSRSGNKNKR